MIDKVEILEKRFAKLDKHYVALKEYKLLIDDLLCARNIYEPSVFNSLEPEKRAILDAYLKRFSSIQDYLVAKVFSLVLDIAGIGSQKMSDVLYHVEKEQIIDTLQEWLELRDIRNELEHEYPEHLQKALDDLKFCVDSFAKLEKYYFNTIEFAQRHIGATIG